MIENTQQRYGAVAVALHWLMAALLIGLAAIGLYMVRLPDAGFDTVKISLIFSHKELGMLALALAALRLAWRVGNELPRLTERLPEWQKVAARFVHLSFYALMFGVPISGWLMSSASGFPVTFLGLFKLPDLIGYDNYLLDVLVAVHKWLAYALVALIGLHAAAALRHHFILRDDTLRKMLPSVPEAASVNPFVRRRTRQAPSEPSR